MDQNPRSFVGRIIPGRHALRIVPTLIRILLVTVVWEVIGRVLWIQPDILPTPSRILLEWIHESERLQAHGIITAAEVL
jgi:ABC-type nitrate/sulfonate/bicarbonate transport system permease component